MSAVKKKVAYFYDPEVGGFYYGLGHPMKPHRIRMAHNLILHYGLANMMEVYRPRLAEDEDFVTFHTEDYIHFLRNISPETMDQLRKDMKRFNVGEDCPIFSGMYRFCQLYAGASIGGAVKLNYSRADVVINWSGGLHHAKKAEASGFCYVNDIVLAILELLKYHARVLYVDIDIHHGDGVEEAFLTTDRVMTVSFHKFGGSFFPGTGDISNCGHGRGRYYAVNVPLKDGMDDTSYEMLFKPVMRKVMEVYQPEVIVFQSGADSLAGDRLGVFNLSMKGHAECLHFMGSFGLPMLVLGGGGYKINNVARCWAYETGRILGVELEDELPDNEYRSYFAPDYRLHIPVWPDLENLNTLEYLEQVQRKVFMHLSRLGAPNGVAFTERPQDGLIREDILAQPPPTEGASRLWDGNASEQMPNGGEPYDDAAQLQQPSGRSRLDIDYSDNPSSSGRASADPLSLNQQPSTAAVPSFMQFVGKGNASSQFGTKGDRNGGTALEQPANASIANGGYLPMGVDAAAEINTLTRKKFIREY